MLNANVTTRRDGRWPRPAGMGYGHGVGVVIGLVLGVMCASAPLRTVVAQRVERSATSPAATASATPDVTVDHTLYDQLLHRYVKDGLVDYDGLARAPEFSRYLASLDRVRLEQLSEDERLAFWINAYNASTLQLIITHRETQSIRRINRTFGVLRLKGPWSAPIVRAAGRQLSLDDVQHGILRKMQEPRVHFALSCAAKGCPPLRSEAYTGARLLDQLEDQARRFLQESPTKNYVTKRVAHLSPVLLAYRNDFGATRADFLKALAPWFASPAREALAEGRLGVVPTPFDWTLNRHPGTAR